MPQLPPIVLLNGTSSAGKTSIVHELQERLPEPYLRVALDHLFDMVPKPWGGGRGGPLSHDGFRYHDGTDAAGRPVTTIGYGEVGARLLRAFHRSVATLVDEGCRVLVDVLPLDRADAEDWRRALGGHRSVTVAVTAPIGVLEARERERGGRPGLARGHLGCEALLPADLVLDTATGSPEQLADRLIRYLTTDVEDGVP